MGGVAIAIKDPNLRLPFKKANTDRLLMRVIVDGCEQTKFAMAVGNYTGIAKLQGSADALKEMDNVFVEVFIPHGRQVLRSKSNSGHRPIGNLRSGYD